MGYCFNPDCLQPQNPDKASICQSCGTRLWLRDRYKALELLGKGNRGRTFRVLDQSQTPSCHRFLKQFFPVSCSEFETLVMSLEEVSYHPSIPKLIDAFEQDNNSYIVQEWVEGINLRRRVTEQGVFNPNQVWHLLENILPVLESIHQYHFVHREIKPANILQVPCSSTDKKEQSQYILIDWTCLGKDTDNDIVGDAEYAAPEQLLGQAIAASDLYSLGVTCLYCLTGVPPFDLLDGVNNTWNWRNYWFLEGEDSTIQGRGQRLEYILDKLVAFNLSDRYLSAREVLRVMGHQPASFSMPSPNGEEGHRGTGAENPPLRVGGIGVDKAYPSIIGSPPGKQVFSWHCEAILSGHQGLFAAVNAVAFSLDGTKIASGSDDCTVRLWNLNSSGGRFEEAPAPIPPAPLKGGKGGDKGGRFNGAILTGHTQFVKSIAFSPTLPLCLASGSADGMIYLWEPETQQPIYTLQAHEQKVNALAFNPTGDLLVSASTDKTIKFWHSQTGQLVKTFAGHTLGVTSFALSPWGDFLVSGSQDRTVKLWDLETGNPRLTLTGHTWAVRAIALNSEGTLIASAGDDHRILLWDVASGKCVQSLSGHSWVVSALGFIETWDHSLILISGSWDKTLKLWEVKTGQQLAVLTGHTDSINALAIYPMGNYWFVVSGSQDKTIRLWQLS